MMNLETLAEPAGLLRRKSMVKPQQLKRIEVSCSRHDFFAGEVNVGDVSEEPGEIFLRPTVGDLDMPWSESGA